MIYVNKSNIEYANQCEANVLKIEILHFFHLQVI